VELPLIEMELRRAARQRSTFLVRLVPPVIAAIGCAAVGLFWGRDVTEIGNAASGFLAWLSMSSQFALVFLVAPLASTPLLASERQSQSLDLLLLAVTSRTDLYLAKLFSAFFQCELLLLSLLPITSMASFLGGVSIAAMFAQFLLMSMATLLICSMCLFVSSLTERLGDAYIWSTLAIGTWMILEWPARFLLNNPISGLFNTGAAIDGLFAAIPDFEHFPYALVECSVVTIAFGFGATIVLCRQPGSRAHASSSRSRLVPLLSTKDPIVRLYNAAFLGVVGRWLQYPNILALLLLFTLLTLVLPPVAFTFPILALYLATAGVTLTKQNGSLELLLLIDDRDAKLPPALFRSQLRRAVSVVLLPWMVAGIYTLRSEYASILAAANVPFSASVAGAAGIVVVQGVTFVAVLAQCTALGCWASTWNGGLLSKTTRAVLILLGTYILILFVPCCFGGTLISAAGTVTNDLLVLMGVCTIFLLPCLFFTSVWEQAFSRSFYSGFYGSTISRRFK
jgi:hypothetical protein